MITEKITVLFDAHNLNKKAGGIETYNQNLLKALRSEKNLKLRLYANKTAKYLPEKGTFIPISDSGAYRLLSGFGQAINRHNPDIIHTNNFLPFPAPETVKKIVTLHDICFLNEKSSFSRWVFRTLLAYSLLNADGVIAVSQFTKEQILSFLGRRLSAGKITVIHHGVAKNIRQIPRPLARGYIAKKYGVKDDFFLVSGNLTPRKNLPLLIFLAHYLNKTHPSLKIVVSGKKEARLGSSPENIVFLNYVADKDLNYLYNACLALLFPSTCEGFGLPVIEAARTKTPIVSSPIAAVKEVAGETVLYAPKKKDWINALEKIIKNDYPPGLIENAYRHSLLYSWEEAARKTKALYQATLETR